MSGYRYEVCLNHAGRWYWRRVSSNGETQFVAQAYSSKSNARRAIRNLDPNATITDGEPA